MHAVKTLSNLAIQEMLTIQTIIKSIGDLNTRVNTHHHDFKQFETKATMKLFQIEQSIKNNERMMSVVIMLLIIILVVLLISLIK